MCPWAVRRWAEDHLIVTRDRGRTWQNFTFTDDCPACEGSLNTVAPARLPDGSAQGGGTVSFRNLGALNLTEGGSGNITGSASGGSIQFYLTEAGEFARRPAGRVNVTGLPDVRSLRYGSGGVIALADGTLVISTIAVLSTGPGYLSCIALRSTDGGYAWRFASVITAWAEVPYAHEGPSESSLAFLNNGSLLCIMRVEGQSGRYSPYITKLSDDGGLSWHSLRSISTGGSGGVGGAGCVRPRLLPLIAESGGRSLVLSGGRPNPLSRDVLLWLNAAGDGEAWEAFSVSYWHNRLVTNSSWLFPPAATNDSRTFPRLSTSYTSLVRTANNSGYVVYGMGIRSFAMGFQLTQG